MSEIPYLDDYRPHKAGMAECRTCHYKWAFVAPVIVEGALECPQCHEIAGHVRAARASERGWEAMGHGWIGVDI